MRTLKLFLAAASIGGASLAHAYIPKTLNIAGRVARFHGRGAYVVEQDVQFRTGGDPIVLRERWTIENGDRMRLFVSASQGTKIAEPVRFEILYRDGRKYFTDIGGNGVKTTTPGSDFFESFFHLRTAKGFLTSLVRARIGPAAILNDSTKLQKIEQIKHVPESYVRLGRTGGDVMWIIGEPSPPEGKLNPQAWIEQDAFVVRRLRFPSEAEITADRVSQYPNGLRFPRERIVTWESNSATIRVVSVRATPTGPADRAMEVGPFQSAAKPGRLPDLAQIREFYTRFR